MNYKKYLLLAGACAAIALPASAQESQTGTSAGSSYGTRDMTYRGDSYDVLDSALVPGSRMSQHRKFLNHQYNFPAKPRNMWEVGASFGLYNISGDVPSLMLWQKGGYAFGVHVRKALGYVISLRADYNYGVGKGLGWQPSSGFTFNEAWTGANGGPDYSNPTVNPSSIVVYNYKMESHQLNLDVVASLGNVLFHKSRTKIDPYVFLGIAGNAYQTWVNAADASGKAYDFNSILSKYPNPSYKDRKNIKKDLRDYMDDSYETAAESDRTEGNRRPGLFSTKKLTFAATFGAGLQFRLTKRVNLSVEDRVTFFPTTNEDLLDGQRWDEGSSPINNVSRQVPSQNKDGINYFSVGVNVNLGGGSKNVEPLYWLNPLDYSYGELGNPRHMILPEPILADADGDGITDQLDKCPGTPAGVAVDAHGCPMDTDGDGVPDDRDKQLITPTECQPVDADGVGKCPCPEDCPTGGGSVCGNIMGGSLMFGGNSARITPSMQAQLATLAAQMQAGPDCRVVITGNGAGSKAAQQRSWDRVNAVIEYMSEKNGIDRNRFIFNYQGQGDPNVIMYRAANKGEEGPSNVPPPHPNLRRD